MVAVKAGMTQEWDSWGVRVPLTILWIDECEVCLMPASSTYCLYTAVIVPQGFCNANCNPTSLRARVLTTVSANLIKQARAGLLAQVVQVKTLDREGYLALQLGCGAKRDKQVDKQCAPAALASLNLAGNPVGVAGAG